MTYNKAEKYLIVGRTASGKDTLREILEKEYGWKFVKSYATRPKRNEDEDTHIFISQDEADAIPDEDKAAATKIGDYEYFATKEQIDEADGYIIDPKGLAKLRKNMPNTLFTVVNIRPANDEDRMDMAIKRSDDPEEEVKVLQARIDAEQEQFDEFDSAVADGTISYDNVMTILTFENDYKKSRIEKLAHDLEMRRRLANNTLPIVKYMIDKNILDNDENGMVMLYSGDEAVKMQPEIFVQYLCMEMNNEEIAKSLFAHTMLEYMTKANMKTSDKEEVIPYDRLMQIANHAIDELAVHLCDEDRARLRSNYFSDLTDEEANVMDICDEESED